MVHGAPPPAAPEMEGVLRQAAETWGTPVFVLAEQLVGGAAARVEAAFPDPWLRHYSLKANDLPAVAATLHRRGWGANVVSVGEWAQAAAGGVGEAETTFEGVGKSDAQLEDVVAAAVAGRPLRWIVVESPDEIRILAELAGQAGLGAGGAPPLDVLLRLNPQVEPETARGLAVGGGDTKFGMTESEVLDLAGGGLPGGPGLRWRGVHVHVGSQLGSVHAWSLAGVRAVSLWERLRRESATCDTVDFGGGFPTAGPAPLEFRRGLESALGDSGLALPPRRAIEPGRYLVGHAAWLVARVLHSRPDRGGGPQVVVDGGMTELIRPALYDARHPVVALGAPGRGSPPVPTAVEGPVCESTDTHGTHLLPPLRRGDLVAIGEAGAYAASFTSRFNGRPAPAEVVLRSDGSLVRGGRAPIPEHRPARRAVGDVAPARRGRPATVRYFSADGRPMDDPAQRRRGWRAGRPGGAPKR